MTRTLRLLRESRGLVILALPVFAVIAFGRWLDERTN